jgi:mono/diheme cytochrome c family protein
VTPEEAARSVPFVAEMARLPTFVIALALVAAGCGGSGAQISDSEIEARVAAADPADGQPVFDDICAACHGPEGQGGIGARLVGVGGRLSAPEIHNVVTDGRGRMPAWGGRLEADEVDAVVAYVLATFPAE